MDATLSVKMATLAWEFSALKIAQPISKAMPSIARNQPAIGEEQESQHLSQTLKSSDSCTMLSARKDSNLGDVAIARLIARRA